MNDHDRQALRCELAYAVRQLQQRGDTRRALDALERALAMLNDPEPAEWTAEEILNREG